MALNATQQWWIRTDGDNTNGGGYDSAISGAGTNYCDQAAAQLSLTDLATSGAGSTTLTSVTGGFTAQMIGNIIRISSGTNFQAGYYAVTGHTDTNTVTLDRTPTSGGAGSVGVGKLGGAFALFEPLMSTGASGLNTPAIPTPLAAGHTINVRGAGTADPSVVDYDYKGTSQSGYYTVPNGNTTAGKIAVIGYNGRPLIQFSGLLFAGAAYWHLETLAFKAVTSAGWADRGVFNSTGGANCSATKCIFDANGNDCTLIQANVILDCDARNSGGGAAGTQIAFVSQGNGGGVFYCTVRSVRGTGMSLPTIANAIGNLVVNCGLHGIRSTVSGYSNGAIIGNTVNGCGGDGIRIENAVGMSAHPIYNNIIANNTGYGINVTVGTLALNDRIVRGLNNYNDIYNNTSGALNALTIGANSITTNPTFTDTGSLDYSVGTNMKAAGFPGLLLGTATTGYTDLGAAQRQEPTGGGGAPVIGNAGIVIRGGSL